MDEKLIGEWQKRFVNDVVEKTGITHQSAMVIMAEVCNIRQTAYMIGYNRGFDSGYNSAKNKYSKKEGKR